MVTKGGQKFATNVGAWYHAPSNQHQQWGWRAWIWIGVPCFYSSLGMRTPILPIYGAHKFHDAPFSIDPCRAFVDVHLRLAVQRKINSYRQQYANNQNISFLCRSHHFLPNGEFLRLRFLQAHRKTEAHFTAIATQPIRLVPFQARGILPVVEDQILYDFHLLFRKGGICGLTRVWSRFQGQ